MQGISEKVWLAQGISDIPTHLKCPQLKYKQNEWRLKELWPYILLAFHFKNKKPEAPCTHAHPAPWLRPSFHLFQGDETPPHGAQPGCPGHGVLVLISAVSAEQQISAVRNVEQTPCLTFTGLLWARTKAWIPIFETLGQLKSGSRTEACGWTSISRVSVRSSVHKHFCHSFFLLYSTMNQELLLWNEVRPDHKWK